MKITTKTNIKIAIYILLPFLFLLIMLVLALTSCQKTNIDAIYFDPDCGVISSKVQAGQLWITAYQWNSGERDTIAWHFDPGSGVGDTICKLKELNDLSEYECKP
jgi:hypothetical protein